MIFAVSIATAFLFGGGFYLLMKRGLINRALGLLLISHGANFVILSMASLKDRPGVPILPGPAETMADPLPQALILTALVIGFSVAAFLWTLVLRLRKETSKAEESA